VLHIFTLTYYKAIVLVTILTGGTVMQMICYL